MYWMHSKPNQPTRPPVKPGRPAIFGTECCAAQALDFGERIGDLARLDQLAAFGDEQRVPGERVHALRRQADDRIAAEALAALDRFEQVGVRAVGELEVDRQRRVEVGQHLAHHRDAGVAGGGELLELFGVDLHAARGGKRGRAVCQRRPGADAVARFGVLRPLPRTPALDQAGSTAGGGSGRSASAGSGSGLPGRPSSGQPGGRCMRTRPATHSMRKRVASTGSPSRLSVSGSRRFDLDPRQLRAHRDAVERGVLAFGDQRADRGAELARQLRHDGQVEQAVVDHRVRAQRLPAAGLAAVAEAERDELAAPFEWPAGPGPRVARGSARSGRAWRCR